MTDAPGGLLLVGTDPAFAAAIGALRQAARLPPPRLTTEEEALAIALGATPALVLLDLDSVTRPLEIAAVLALGTGLPVLAASVAPHHPGLAAAGVRAVLTKPGGPAAAALAGKAAPADWVAALATGHAA